MYYNSHDQQQFRESEKAGLDASALYARMAWSRADANAQRIALAEDATAQAESHAKRERFRVAHREAMSFESDIEDDDEYGDLDEYGYAA